MTASIVKLDGPDWTAVARQHLTDEEYKLFSEDCSHPATVGHILFNDDAQTLTSHNVDETQTAVFANVFDICSGLTEELGQKSHQSAVFESRKMEITCRRLSKTRYVLLRAKGQINAGG